MQRQVGGDASTPVVPPGSRSTSPTGQPLSWLLQQMRRLERPTRTRQPRPQPSSTSGCRSQSAVCCGNVGTQENRAERERELRGDSVPGPQLAAEPIRRSPASRARSAFRAGHRTAWAPGRLAAADKVSIPRSFRGMPDTHGLGRDLELAGDLGLADAGGEQLGGAQPASLQAITLCRRAARDGWHAGDPHPPGSPATTPSRTPQPSTQVSEASP
jgi:hypothetical protein